MSALRVPHEHRTGLLAILGLSESATAAIVNALRQVRPRLSRKQFLSDLESRVSHVAPDDIRLAANTLLAMYAVRGALDMPVGAFVSEILSDLETAGALPANSDEWMSAARERLIKLLRFDSPLGITAKASYIAAQYEHTFCTAQVLTDIRPVFGDDVTSAPDCAVITHSLRLHYHDGPDFKEMFFALDGADLRGLQEVLRRAEQKEMGLKALLDRAGIARLEE